MSAAAAAPIHMLVNAIVPAAAAIGSLTMSRMFLLFH
jgi:hypothetical protein